MYNECVWVRVCVVMRACLQVFIHNHNKYYIISYPADLLSRIIYIIWIKGVIGNERTINSIAYTLPPEKLGTLENLICCHNLLNVLTDVLIFSFCRDFQTEIWQVLGQIMAI